MGWFQCKWKSNVRLDGKTVVITGCSAGIGKMTVLDLYSRGARVVMACRDIPKTEAARDWIQQQCKDQSGTGQLSIVQLNLASLSSVRSCAQQILVQEEYIHILINNAGVMMSPKALTEDGFELQFGTNHLGHFLFTLILLPKIISSAPARIVTVSSVLHASCESMSFDDINLDKAYNPRIAYYRSKMANVLFTRELSKRLKDTGVTVYSLHPGVVDTELSRNLDSVLFPGASWLYSNIGGIFMKNAKQGAQTTLYCAIDESAAHETGLYYDDCKVATPGALAKHDEVAEKLWDISLDMVNYSPPHPFGKSSQST